MKMLISMTFVVLTVAAGAGTKITWKGGGATTAWSDGSNWEGGTAPALGDTAVIPSGEMATMTSADITYVSADATKLAGISLAAADSGLSIKNGSAVSLKVPLSGIGSVEIDNGGSALTLAANNANYCGPMTIRKSCVNTDYSHGNAFGKDNVVTNIVGSGSTSCNVSFFVGGNYYNTWQVLGGDSPNSKSQSFVSYAAVVFKKPLNVDGAFVVNAAQVTSSFVLGGGVFHTGTSTLYFWGNVTVGAGTVCDFDRKGNFDAGGCVGGGTLTLNTPVLTRNYFLEQSYATYVYSRLGGGGGMIKCGQANVLTGMLGIQFGAPYASSGVIIDLNGFDQACGTMYMYPNANLTKGNTCITSAKPATLTMRGQWEYYGNQPAEAVNRTTPLAINGMASFEFWPTNAIRNVSGAIWPVINFKDTEWTTTGRLACRRGTMSLASDVSAPNLKGIEVTHEGELVVKTSSVNADHFVLAVTNNTPRTGKSPLTLDKGVVLRTDRAVIGDVALEGSWLQPGTYGGEGAYTNGLVDAKHKLDLIAGDGCLTVNRCWHPGLAVIIR